MSKILNGNGNGNGHGAQSLLRQIERKVARAKTAASPHAVKESGVTFQTAEGVELRGALSRMTRHTVVFELYSPDVTLRLSEVLAGFEIIFQERPIYSGRATVRNAVNAGSKIVCEATLKEEDWTGLDLTMALQDKDGIGKNFKKFLKEWQKSYKVLPEFKVAVTDLQMFLHDLRLWIDKLELNTHAIPGSLQKQLENETAKILAGPVSKSIDTFIERFESIAKTLDKEENQWNYRIFMRRQIHPLLLCAPFVNHTFNKPHGYAGDFDAVNMIVRNQFEGDSLYAKIINFWFLQQPPAQAHRNRIQFLCKNLIATAARVIEEGRIVRIASVGCGPAHEAQKFLQECHLCDFTEFTLVDFEPRALAYTQAALNAVQRKYERGSRFICVKKSVNQILKEAAKKSRQPDAKQYDLVYCAGLFDYLTDPICLELTRVLYDWVAPGGLLITTNVDIANPRRLTMDYLLEWHLIYRNQSDLMALRPENIPEDVCKVTSDSTGVNIYFEAQKLKHG